MQNNSSIEIYNETKWPHKKWPFLAIKNEILGENFQLSLSILSPKNSKKINISQRKKDYIPNTLSFKYSKVSGEIILTPAVIKKECVNFGHSANKHTLYLFIHSCAHLTGLDHGEKMDKLEAKFFKIFLY